MGSIKKPSLFILSGVEVKGSQVVVSWVDEGNELTRKSKLPIHPDLQKLFNRMSYFVAKYCKASDDKQHDLCFKQVVVHDYEDDEGQSVQIKATHIHPASQQKTTWTTAKMQVHGADYGFEAELKKCIVDLGKEACAYVFDNKSNQTTMDFDSEEDSEEAA